MEVRKISRKQCSNIYRAFKQGILVPPTTPDGYKEHYGFIYRFEGAIPCIPGKNAGDVLTENEEYWNAQLDTIYEINRCLEFGYYKRAQELLDGKDWHWLAWHFPVSVINDYVWREF